MGCIVRGDGGEGWTIIRVVVVVVVVVVVAAGASRSGIALFVAVVVAGRHGARTMLLCESLWIWYGFVGFGMDLKRFEDFGYQDP